MHRVATYKNIINIIIIIIKLTFRQPASTPEFIFIIFRLIFSDFRVKEKRPTALEDRSQINLPSALERLENYF